MILLLGGTSDTQPIAERLAHGGHRVLVSRATETPLAVGSHPAIESRCGAVDDEGLARLIRDRGIRAIVDATHPYAAEIRVRAARVAAATRTPYFSFVRPPVIPPDAAGVERAANHAAAAAMALAHGRPVLLTTGSNHLAPYADASRRTGVQLVVRVLGHPQSLAACRAAGLPENCILTGRGPFTVEENRRQIRDHGIGVLVTKDSGAAGGTIEKLEAARAEACCVVVVERPVGSGAGALGDVESLVRAVDCAIG
jgi:precorrin-6A/cobalt-precorrin-6A reductase